MKCAVLTYSCMYSSHDMVDSVSTYITRTLLVNILCGYIFYITVYKYMFD